MIAPASFLTFIAASIALILAPGPAQLLVVSRTLSDGTHTGAMTAPGLNVGTPVHAVAAALGNGVVAGLMGGTPRELPARYQAASPLLMLPLRVPQLVIHATSDDIVPVAIARSYTRAAREAGDRIELLELSEGGHLEFLDPASVAHESLCAWLTGESQLNG